MLASERKSSTSGYRQTDKGRARVQRSVRNGGERESERDDRLLVQDHSAKAAQARPACRGDASLEARLRHASASFMQGVEFQLCNSLERSKFTRGEINNTRRAYGYHMARRNAEAWPQV